MYSLASRSAICLAMLFHIACASSAAGIGNKPLTSRPSDSEEMGGSALASAVIGKEKGKSMLPDPQLPVDGFLTPSQFFVWTNVPRSIKVGQRITIEVDLMNHQQQLPFKVDSIDIAGTYLKGFEVLKILPAPASIDWFGSDLTINYEHAVPPTQSWHVTIEVVPRTPGVYSGDLDVWWDSVNISSRLQTAVTD